MFTVQGSGPARPGGILRGSSPSGKGKIAGTKAVPQRGGRGRLRFAEEIPGR